MMREKPCMGGGCDLFKEFGQVCIAQAGEEVLLPELNQLVLDLLESHIPACLNQDRGQSTSLCTPATYVLDHGVLRRTGLALVFLSRGQYVSSCRAANTDAPTAVAVSLRAESAKIKECSTKLHGLMAWERQEDSVRGVSRGRVRVEVSTSPSPRGRQSKTEHHERELMIKYVTSLSDR